MGKTGHDFFDRREHWFTLTTEQFRAPPALRYIHIHKQNMHVLQIGQSTSTVVLLQHNLGSGS